MNIIKARKAGVAAFNADMQRAPCLNKEFMLEVFNRDESVSLCDCLDAYLYGWDVANLAYEAIKGSPSIAALFAIINSEE